MVYSRYRIGYYYERKLVQYFRKQGWDAWRTPASKTPIDIVAIRDNNGIPKVKLIQIKATSRENFSFYSLPREERGELLELAHRYRNNPNVDIELWVFFRKTRKKKVINIKEIIENPSV